ncbi:uncharacterized protein LOC113369980 [Ctenocephalides felis]|uniref:uncharacterized protein LOC113369980 n=1 Tax=Ctenocephalides felis TaxID=7515 RepID=UPI000E6E33CC|nr:uncharacterized protein LOC113369980 [Ctenocephalides felis]
MLKKIRAIKLFKGKSQVQAPTTSETNTSPANQNQQINGSQPQNQPIDARVNPAEWRFRTPASRYLSSGESSSESSSEEDPENNEGRWSRRPPPRYRSPPAVVQRPQPAAYISVPDRLDYLVPDIVRQCNSVATPNQDQDSTEANASNPAQIGPDMGQRVSAACTHPQRPRSANVTSNPGHHVPRKQPKRSNVSLSWAIRASCNNVSDSNTDKNLTFSKGNWTDRLNNKQQNDLYNASNKSMKDPLMQSISNTNTFRNGPFKCNTNEERSKKNEKYSNEHQRRMNNNNQYSSLESKAVSEPDLHSDSISETGNCSKKSTKHRRKKDKSRIGFGYQIRDINDFLTSACLENPANIPVVLGCPSVLYRTRPGGFQEEIQLPLGMVVNAVFKNRSWLYVQTPHAEEGYINHGSCLPLGILPTQKSRNNSSSGKTSPCWESTVDVFPLPCGNLTDSEKEHHLRGGTRSECGGTTTRRKRSTNPEKRHRRGTRSLCRENGTLARESSVDRLFLQAAGSTEYAPNTSKVAQTCKTKPLPEENSNTCLRHTLLAVCEEYTDEHSGLELTKGDVVILVSTVRARDGENWFHIRNREGKEGLIPAYVVGNGFL